MKKSPHAKQDKISFEADPYQPSMVSLFEAIYGKNLISLGGLAAIDNLFSDLNIRDQKALDLGFGLGGVAFYLAEKHYMKIAGVEMHSWMVQHANDHRPAHLSNSLEFNTYNNAGKLPYQPETFDLVYSKGVLNHVADKISLFQQVNVVLKPNGLFVIADWVFPKKSTDSSSPLVCETKESYEKTLIDTGFGEINFRDDSKFFIIYANELLQRLANNKNFIEQKYGEELFLTIQKQHEDLIDNMNQGKKFATRIIAKKMA
jgi:ubiquinone/menaquinone biosynthesis C-methylase UbiE